VADGDAARFELVGDARSGLAGAANDENGVVGHVSNSTARIRDDPWSKHSMACPIVWKGTPPMNKVSLIALAREHLETARAARSGRSAQTVYGGHEHSLRQTLIALTAGSQLDEHESPGEATLQVLHGRVTVTNAQVHWDGSPGDHIAIPQSRHGLRAVEDSVVLLTVAKAVGPHT
jgi:quercetin dioxygenase-like cupin family protein